ncbi:MAG: MFS transporter [Candidatus Bathyarchaeia archaeon]|nr:MFS transporter [Candidatus Bathyarchaeota archaeon]
MEGRLQDNLGILVGGFLSLFILNLLNSAYSPVLILIKEELALTYTLSGALMSSYHVGYTIGQIPWGYIADRYGCRRAMTMSLIGTASAMILFGVSSSIWQVMVSRFMAGLLGAGIFVPSVKLVSTWFSSSLRGTVLGVLSIGGSLGMVIASWSSPLISIALGWRRTLILLGIVGVTSSLPAWLGLRDREGQRVGIGGDLKGLFRSRSFWLLAFIQFLRLGSYYTFIAWLPLLLSEEHGLNIIAAGAALSLFNISGMLSNPLGGVISDRVGERLILFSTFMSLAPAAILLNHSGSGSGLYLAVFLIGWLVNFSRSPSFTVIARLYGVGLAGRISGIHNTFASLGALALPFMLGYVRDVTSTYGLGLVIISILMLLGALSALFVKAPGAGSLESA